MKVNFPKPRGKRYLRPKTWTIKCVWICSLLMMENPDEVAFDFALRYHKTRFRRTLSGTRLDLKREADREFENEARQWLVTICREFSLKLVIVALKVILRID